MVYNPCEIDVSLTVLTVSIHPGISLSPSVCTPHVLLLSLIALVCDGVDLCTSRRILMPFPEAEGCFRGFSGPAVLAQPGPPALGVQPELWERHCGGAPGLPVLAPLAGQYGPAREKCRASHILLTQHRMRTAVPHGSDNGNLFLFSKVVEMGVVTNTKPDRQWTQTGKQRYIQKDRERERETSPHLAGDSMCGQRQMDVHGKTKKCVDPKTLTDADRQKERQSETDIATDQETERPTLLLGYNLE